MNSNEQDSGRHEPLYNIGLVSRVVDIPENTLRAWERRYGFPQASRTEGGHRLYSEYEIQRLQWVKTRVDSGMQISQAVRALQQVEDEGRFPESSLSSTASSPYDQVDPLTLEQLRGRILEALLKHEGEQADQILADILAVYSLDIVILNLIGPLFNDIGQAWADDQIGIATEHFATQRLRGYLQSWMQTSAPPYQVKPVLIACAPDEWHEGSSLMLSVLLRRLRYPVIYLGQSMPLADLAQFITEFSPSAIVLIAMTTSPALALQELPDWLPDMDSDTFPPICYGGLAFSTNPKLIEETPGIYLGDTLQAGLQKLNSILRELHSGDMGRLGSVW